jgi:hypothetical protein
LKYRSYISPLPVLLLLTITAASQFPTFSIATDLSVQHNFKKEQRYWAIGQTVHAHFHLDARQGVYVSFTYYSNGKFKNNLVATAKSPVTVPQQIPYVNSGKMRLKEFSVGFKKYLLGTCDAEKGIGIYGYGGFGLVLGRIENTHSISIDTASYDLPVLSGKANFKRLSIDLGAGLEQNIGGEIYLYGEGRVWIPTTDYPSKFIFVNRNAPWTVMLNIGLRILF